MRSSIPQTSFKKSADRANTRNTTPPIIVTVLTDILVAINRPPITAKPVQNAWPSTPPRETPRAFSLAPNIIVVNWLRSPHSAKKVMVKAKNE